MVKYKLYVIGIVGICLLAGCGNSNIDNITIEQNDNPKAKQIQTNKKGAHL
ncbi:MAG: hypothetical protein HDR71_05090 [Lachnospiraceae bacterium]|nr:hypothetical protein [Lachnospiraceae bacterium]